MANSHVTWDGRTGAIGAGGVVNFSNDDGMNVLFYRKEVNDPEESLRRGRPYSKGMTYVRIQHPGEKDYVDRPVKDHDDAIRRWPRQWAAFENNQQQIPSGTPIDVLFPTMPEIPANLHTIGIHTVEQLAGLTAHGLQTVGMGATQWQQKAKEFLSAANGGAGMHQLRAQNERQANAIEVLTGQVAALASHIERLTAEQKQGVPATMVPVFRPTVAQAHAASLPAYQPAPELSDEPLFVEAEDSVEGPEISQPISELPRRRGRPPGSQNRG